MDQSAYGRYELTSLHLYQKRIHIYFPLQCGQQRILKFKGEKLLVPWISLVYQKSEQD